MAFGAVAVLAVPLAPPGTPGAALSLLQSTRLLVHLTDDRAEGVVGVLRRAVGPEQPGLPSRQVRLVADQEVEDCGDVGLAVGHPQAVRKLRRLVWSRARVRRPRLRRRRGYVRQRAGPVLDTGVETLLRVVDLRLVAGLQVPDRDAVVRGRLPRPTERLPQPHEQPVEVSQRHDQLVAVRYPRPLVRAGRIRVVPEGVEEWTRPPARAIGSSHPPDERRRRVRDVRERVGIVIAPDGGSGADDVDGRPQRVEGVPAAREQRHVARWCVTRAGHVVLGFPEKPEVGLVPDHEVVDLRIASDQPAEVRAVLVPGTVVERRLALRREHRDDDADPGALHDSLVDEHDVEWGEVDLTRLPRERDPDRLQPEVAGDREGRAGRPLETVLASADEHAGLSACGSRNGQHGEREDDPDPTPHPLLQPRPFCEGSPTRFRRRLRRG